MLALSFSAFDPERTFDVFSNQGGRTELSGVAPLVQTLEIEFSSRALLLKIPAPAELHKDSIDEMECR
jgi:hypothetical protein